MSQGRRDGEEGEGGGGPNATQGMCLTRGTATHAATGTLNFKGEGQERVQGGEGSCLLVLTAAPLAHQAPRGWWPRASLVFYPLRYPGCVS